MSCTDTNPCSNPCDDSYDNCGCINPTTFGCVTHSGSALECIDVINGEDGDSILGKIDAAVCVLQDAKGKILIDGNDSCLGYTFDKLEAGLNITLTQTGEGCDKKIRIDAVEGGVPVDINAKISANDTTTGYLNDKLLVGTYMSKTIISPSGVEKLKFDVVPSTLISEDDGNQLTLGDDGKLKTLYTAPDGSETVIIAGDGVVVSGLGTSSDPYIVSTNPSIQAARLCFDGVWRNLTLVATGNASVVYVSGTPQYRYRYDGTIEFKGSATYTVAYGAYSTSTRKHTVTIGNLSTSCITLTEQAGTVDLKSINYIDVPQASADQITQIYGYIIRKSAQNIVLEFQSSFTNATSKTVVVNFEGAVSHPSF